MTQRRLRSAALALAVVALFVSACDRERTSGLDLRGAEGSLVELRVYETGSNEPVALCESLMQHFEAGFHPALLPEASMVARAFPFDPTNPIGGLRDTKRYVALAWADPNDCEAFAAGCTELDLAHGTLLSLSPLGRFSYCETSECTTSRRCPPEDDAGRAVGNDACVDECCDLADQAECRAGLCIEQRCLPTDCTEPDVTECAVRGSELPGHCCGGSCTTSADPCGSCDDGVCQLPFVCQDGTCAYVTTLPAPVAMGTPPSLLYEARLVWVSPDRARTATARSPSPPQWRVPLTGTQTATFFLETPEDAVLVCDRADHATPCAGRPSVAMAAVRIVDVMSGAVYGWGDHRIVYSSVDLSEATVAAFAEYASFSNGAQLLEGVPAGFSLWEATGAMGWQRVAMDIQPVEATLFCGGVTRCEDAGPLPSR
ncbi:MAG: hypothetical protein AB7S26_14015 [Sandaracinaceae bacterium]